jgi:hypothetical protein
MKVRPASVTVIAWILIVIGGMSLILTTAMLNNPSVKLLMVRTSLPLPVQYVITYVGQMVMITSGFAMLERQNWARLLYVIWSAIGFLIGLATSPIKAAIIPELVLYAVVVFFLFRPKVNRYFGRSEVESGTQSH